MSTTKQELDNQSLQLREYCKKQGWVIVKEYSEIVSGTKDSRPAFNDLFLDAHKRRFDLVLFWDLSRFSRSGTLYTLQKLRELEGLGVGWHSFQEPYISTMGQFREVVLSLLATIAKLERDKISERTKAGLERAKQTGVKLGRRAGSSDKRKRERRWFKQPQALPLL